jgi:hypothetical protein
MGTLEVVDLDLDAPRSGLLQTPDQLHADRAAVLLQPQVSQPLGAHQAEVAIDVPDRKPEQESHGGRVDGPHDAAIQRIRAVALVALDPVGVRAGVTREAHELGRVVLAVPVRIEDPIPLRGAERRPQRPSIAAIEGVLDDPQPGLSSGKLPQAGQRLVRRPVVDGDDLPLHAELIERPGRPLDEPPDRLGVVVAEQACRDGFRRAQARAAHTRSTSSSVSSG